MVNTGNKNVFPEQLLYSSHVCVYNELPQGIYQPIADLRILLIAVCMCLLEMLHTPGCSSPRALSSLLYPPNTSSSQTHYDPLSPISARGVSQTEPSPEHGQPSRGHIPLLRRPPASGRSARWEVPAMLEFYLLCHVQVTAATTRC